MKPTRVQAGGASTRTQRSATHVDDVCLDAVHALTAVANNVDPLRHCYGRLIGITGPQYEILALVSRSNGGKGVGVTEVAQFIGASTPFVVLETNRLQKYGFLEKNASAVDKRRVELRVSSLGAQRLAELLPYQRKVSEALFGDFSEAELSTLLSRLRRLLQRTRWATNTLRAISSEAELRAAAHTNFS